MSENSLSHALLALIASYREGSTRLHSLAAGIETLVERMQSSLSAEDFGRAMNCFYLIEDVNALTLDEGRQPTQVEQDSIHRQLNLLEALVQ
jgi:hypothetical protein